MAARRKPETTRPGSETSDTQDPKTADAPSSNAHFRVLIGEQELGFCAISRLQASNAPKPDEPQRPPAEPPVDGRATTIVLRRALTRSKDLYLWREQAAAGKRDLRTVTVQQIDGSARSIINTFVLHDCYPVKWTGPEFNALGNDLAMEELEICCGRVEWI